MSLGSFPWQVLIVIGVVLVSIGQVISKYQVHRAASLQVLVYKYLASVVLIWFLWKLSDYSLPSQWWMFIGYGMITGFNVVLYTLASRISLSKTTMTAPVNQILGILFAAILLNEWRLFNLHSQGGIQLMTALFLVPLLFYLLHEKIGKTSEKWTIYMTIYVIAVAGLRVLAKIFLYSVEPIQLLSLQYIGSLVIIILGIKWRQHKFYIGKKFAVLGLTQGVFNSLGILLFLSALKQSSVTQTSLLRMPLFIVLTTSAGLLGFKEIKDMTRKKWLGMLVALGITVLMLTAN